LLAAGLGLLVTLAGVAFAGPVVRLLGASGEVAGYAEPYLRIRVLSAIPVLVAQVGHGWLRGAHDTRTAMYIALAGAALNVGLDYVLIFPVGWGIQGAAWATLIGQACAAAAFLVVLRRRMTGAVWRVEGAVARSLLMVGADLAVRTGSLLAALTLATSIAARMGEVVVASWQIAMQVFLLLAFILDSVAIAGQAMIGRDLGSGDMLRATGVSRRLMEWGLVVGAGLAVLLSAFAWPLAGVFTDDPEVVATAARLILWVALLQPLAAAAFTLDGILIGASDTRFLAVSMLASSGLFVVCALVALERGWGAPGLAIGATVWMVARTVTTGARWRGGRWASPTVGRGSPERVSH
jgi:putative MATE family efflux protein